MRTGAITLVVTLLSIGGLSVACGGGASDSDSSEDALGGNGCTKDACPGNLVPSYDRCSQPLFHGPGDGWHVCVAPAPTDDCDLITDVTCRGGKVKSTTGCIQETYPGALPRAHCVSASSQAADVCTDYLTLTCDERGGEPTTKGCPPAPGDFARPQGHCVPVTSPSSACVDHVNFACPAAFEPSTVGCDQSGASVLQVHCVPSGQSKGCQPVARIHGCAEGYQLVTTGCQQPNSTPGDAAMGKCVSQ